MITAKRPRVPGLPENTGTPILPGLGFFLVLRPMLQIVREASTAEINISGVICDALGGVDTHRAAFTDLVSNQLTTVSHIFGTLVSNGL